MSVIVESTADRNTSDCGDGNEIGNMATENATSEIANKVNKESQSLNNVQHDISLASQYRLELIKTVMTLATGLLAFTVAFPAGRNLTSAIKLPWLIQASWGSLTISVCAGLFHIRMWEMLYMSYRQYDWKQAKEAGRNARNRITRWRRLFQTLQFLGFLIGVFSVGAFAILNLSY
jgi:hypothetical protein